MSALRITPTEHCKAEWSRMASDAYHSDRNAIGHRFSVAAATCLIGASIPIATYDSLMRDYRAWLIGGWREFDMGVRS